MRAIGRTMMWCGIPLHTMVVFPLGSMVIGLSYWWIGLGMNVAAGALWTGLGYWVSRMDLP